MSQAFQCERERRSEDHRASVIESLHKVVSAELLRGKRKLIEHGETTYVLLLTRNGKRILNKQDALSFI